MSLLDMCQLLVFLAKFLLLENYMFSSWFYHNTFLVCNKLIGWYLMKFWGCNFGLFLLRPNIGKQGGHSMLDEILYKDSQQDLGICLVLI